MKQQSPFHASSHKREKAKKMVMGETDRVSVREAEKVEEMDRALQLAGKVRGNRRPI